MSKKADYKNWPVLKHYDQDHLARIALPLGGIGTGTVSLGGRGDLRDWEIMNRPAKGFVPAPRFGAAPFFALYARPAGGTPVARLLEGPLDLAHCEGASGSTAPNHGLPRFRHCSFAAAYPLGQVFLIKLPPRATRTLTFLLTWHFPNRKTWTPSQETCCGADIVGNYYATQYRNAWDVAAKVTAQLPRLEADTVTFARAFCSADLPGEVKEAALFNISTLRTQTCFRTADGRFYGWEGYSDREGCCFGSCTHVWNYEQSLAFLFGDLARGMREVEFLHATNDDGAMSFRVSLPLGRARDFGKAAADGQMGCIVKLYRDWQLSGDDTFLQKLLPKLRQAVEFCWIKGGWDADRDGVMEGCQHNTMDVEYYGPNPQMGLWYLAALRAAEEMFRHCGDTAFAATCRDLFTRGSAWIDSHLFNGDYYEHQIRPPQKSSDVAPSLRLSMGARQLTEPDYQLGLGCLVDQLIGQLLARVCGLGHLVKPAHLQRTLRSIYKYNRRSSLHDHFNCMRTYALGDEAALLMASYPKERPANPFPYFTEVMTGFEYTAAVGMLYEGQIKNSLQCIRDIRARYDGRKRSPFDEAECGHHYARAMIAWAAHLALTGFHYSGVEKSMTFAAREGTFFWSNGYAWGTCKVKKTKKGMAILLSVLYGDLALRHFVLADFGACDLSGSRPIKAGGQLKFTVTSDGSTPS